MFQLNKIIYVKEWSFFFAFFFTEVKSHGKKKYFKNVPLELKHYESLFLWKENGNNMRLLHFCCSLLLTIIYILSMWTIWKYVLKFLKLLMTEYVIISYYCLVGDNNKEDEPVPSIFYTWSYCSELVYSSGHYTFCKPTKGTGYIASNTFLESLIKRRILTRVA